MMGDICTSIADSPKPLGSEQPKKNRYQTPFELKGLDFSIYENPKSDCAHFPDDFPITERCSALKRLCTASLYFDAMNSYKLEEAVRRTSWVEFNEEVYQNVVEDTIHLVQQHQGDIQQIQREWTMRYGVPKCAVSECTKTARHYDRERREKKKEKDNWERDALHAFHQSLHDRVHLFLFHLFDIGMRVETQSLAQGTDDEQGVAVDKQFVAERDRIRLQREECKLDLDRFKGADNKYTIQMTSEKKGGLTLRDALFQKASGSIEIQKGALRRIRDYLEENSFDSECIEMDTEDVLDSNIGNLVQNQAVVQRLADFMRSLNCMFALSLLFHVSVR